MKKTYFFAAVVMFLALPQHSFAELRFGVAAEAYPPFTYKEPSGHWAGWEIDLMTALCSQMAEACSVVEVAWEGIIPALNSHKFDVVLASMAITEKRRAVLAFSEAYYNSSAQLLGRVDTAPYQGPSDLMGKRVGVQAASIHHAYATKYFAAAGGQIQSYGKLDEALSDLAAGRIDYVLGEALALGAFVQSASGKCCHIAGTASFDGKIFGEGVGLGLRQQDVEVRQRLNDALKAIVAGGELDQITAKWHLTGKITLPRAP